MTFQAHRALLLLVPLAFLAACSTPHSTDGSADSTLDAVADITLDAPAMDARCDGAGAMSCSGRCVDTMTDPANCGACGTACSAGMGCMAGHCTVVCPTGQTLCGSVCVTTATDRMNCGACRTTCASGEVCSGGTCATSCAMGLTLCGSGTTAYCANSQTDNHDCGACGNVCPAGQVCSAGACAASCGTGLTDCSGSCVETSTDPMHCGSCTNACALANTSSQACVGGSCVIGSCSAGFGNCDAMATNGCETNVMASDVNNCGGCGIRCAYANAGATCTAGVCGMGTCNAGFADCDHSASNGCEINIDSDNSNCGACSTTSAPTACASGQVCSSATCGATCGAGTVNCSGDCVHLSTNASNCGACAQACALAHVSVQACGMGNCVVGACASGFGDCDLMAGNGCETNVQATDVNNCGGCGLRCSFPNASATCTAGVCARGACNAGFADCDGSAANGCETNTNTDNTHCGGCGTACPAGQVCSSGTCSASCGTGLMACSGSCVATGTDPSNCGGCGTACMLANVSTQACVGSSCVVGSCNSGFSDCDGMATNGCETAVRGSDVNNCGGCGLRCSFANAGATCSTGTCAIGTCNLGFSDCDGSAANGCEINTNTNNTNCGGCGVTCPAGQVCSSGTCATTCGTGLMNCSGACVATTTDPNHCGACANACALPNVTTQACAGGVCAVGACSAGFADCDGAAGNGCETAVRGTDANNCGGCGIACNFPNASASCASGTCMMGACNAGFADCDGNAANGCEVNTNADSSNCGACSHLCAGGTVCSTGTCTTTCGGSLTNCSGSCVNEMTDANHCGSCTNACALPHVSVNACSSSACVVGACALGYGDCNGMASDGCETATLGSDANNCGGCGIVCSFPNASASCASGTCAIGACNTGFADCDGNPANGCEVNVNSDNGNCGACSNVCAGGTVCSSGSCATTCGGSLTNCSGSCVDENNDPMHCGGCTTVCPAAAHQIAVCAARSCAAICTAGWGDCNAMAADGCEAQFANDPMNCGRCGNVCGAGNLCNAGACVPAPAGLVHCWPGDGSGIDVVSGDNATVFPDVTYTAGRSGQAFHCSGVSGSGTDVVARARPSVSSTGPWTYEMWIRWHSADPGAVIFDREWSHLPGAGLPLVNLNSDASGNGVWAIRYDGMGGVPRFFGGTTRLAMDVWTHVAITRGAGLFTAYVNGVSVGTLSDAGMPGLTPDPPRWCGFGDNPGQAMVGEFDGVRIWNRALSPTEIATVATGNASCTAPATLPVTAGLLSHYDARTGSSVITSGPSVTQWNDISGNSFNLTPFSGTPVLNPTLINGYPGVDFTGAGLRVGGVPLAPAASITVFVAMQQRAPAQWGAIVHHGSRDNDWSMEQSGLMPGNVQHFQSVNDNANCNLTLNTGTNYILTGRITGSTRYFSSTSSGTTTPTSCSGNSIAPANLNFYTGVSDNNEHSNAYIGEIVYYNRSLTDAERDQVITYLASRWGI